MENAPEAMDPATAIAESGVLRRVEYSLKRGFDLCGAVFGLLLLSPLFLLIMAMVKITGEGPIFYRHRRIGRFGESFGCLKFRTMVAEGEKVLADHLQRNPAALAEWTATHKLQDDPRVTPLGRVLRKLSLDELPQLINIVTGDMSIVGPRPIVLDELRHYGMSSHFYLRTRPGLTGLWQVSGRSDVSYERRVAFDRHYVETWSFGADIVIILKTIPAVCFSKGSY